LLSAREERLALPVIGRLIEGSRAETG